MNKRDLKAGYVVELQNGRIYMCIPSENGMSFMGGDGFCADYESFNENLENKYFANCNIIRVWGYGNSQEDACKISNCNRPLVWTREKENEIPVITINQLANAVHEITVSSGWWKEAPSFYELIALCHSYLSKALIEYQNGQAPNDNYMNKDGKLDGVPSKLADLIICVLDMCKQYDIDIEYIITESYKYYKSKPYKYGDRII